MTDLNKRLPWLAAWARLRMNAPPGGAQPLGSIREMPLWVVLSDLHTRLAVAEPRHLERIPDAMRIAFGVAFYERLKTQSGGAL